jgi:3-isopropylmalate dehydrogenase
VGGPRWDALPPDKRPERGLLRLRQELDLFANLRPARLYAALVEASTLRPEVVQGIDILVVRELVSDIYYGQPRGIAKLEHGERAFNTMAYTTAEIRRVARLAFELARQRRRKVTSVDKANVLESSRLWRRVAIAVAAQHPDIALEHQLVDSAAMRVITAPAAFDVVVTENMFGDILTDEASVLSGSLGLLPSASLGEGRFGLYEPIHGSAPDIAGTGAANPLGAILSAAMLLRHSLDLPDAAAAVERAVDAAIASGARTRDLGGALGTADMTGAVLRCLSG